MKKPYTKELPYDIRELIKEAMYERRISRSELKDLLNLSQPGVHNILKRNDMYVTRLFTICKALDVNIFRQIADTIEVEYPARTGSNKLTEENEALKKRVAELEKECEVLRDVIGLQSK
jgi:DNA-binding Xre family transcriptional regulator